jgi:hypothetical protein
MENIGNFLAAAESLGVAKNDLFQTVDLYEAQNIPQVSTLLLFSNYLCVNNNNKSSYVNTIIISQHS